MFNLFASNQLNWLPELGIGYYPVTESPYDEKYFQKYRAMADTDIGRALNQARLDLVNKYTQENVIDVGIGCGTFVESRAKTFGFDINPKGVEWLNWLNLYINPYEQEVENATFWDSLEHIYDVDKILKNVKGYVFVSLPIFISGKHILVSKHFRKDEHCWYFSHDGFKLFMAMNDFEYVESNWMETTLGRESIGTYVFKRKT